MKIYLQYPWKFPDSPYYKYLVQSPPSNVEYVNAEKQEGVITSKNFFWFSNFLKRNIRRILEMFSIYMPNSHLSPSGDYDLIHCAHCLSKNIDKPWVADIEMLPSFAVSGWNTEVGQNRVRRILLRKNCKKILPWTEYAKKDILNIYPEIKDKIEVVYPAVPQIKKLEKTPNKILKIIFVARYFDIKCGLIALEVLDRLREKHGVEGIVVSSVSDELKRKYRKLTILPLMSHEKLLKLMSQSDIFLYPSAVDTFGFSLLESMSLGLPIITINTKHTGSRREIVENGKTGLIFDVDAEVNYYKINKNEEEIIKKLIKNTERLILDKELRNQMRKNCLNEIKNGKFSILERNKKLKRIYQEVIK